MRIGIDARLLSGRFTGDRTYWRGLVTGLAGVDLENEYLLYVREPITGNAEQGAEMNRLPPNFQWRTVASKSDRLWSMFALPNAMRRDRVDVGHVQYAVSPLFFLHHLTVVTTVHDVTFRLFPELFRPLDRILLNLSVPDAVRRACGVIAVSQSTRADILRAYKPRPESKVAVTTLAAGPEYRRLGETEREAAREVLQKRYGIGSAEAQYALAVGVLQPRKNLIMLLRAFSAARRLHGFPHRLAVVGKRGWMSSEIESVLASAEAAGDVVLTGYVPDEDLPLLYNSADLMCYPSLYEGFGLPPLEAMSCGCPVMTSNTSSLPEVVGSAGLLLDPLRAGDWIDALGSVLQDAKRQEAMSAAGLKQAASFSWEQTARETLAVYTACHNSAGKCL